MNTYAIACSDYRYFHPVYYIIYIYIPLLNFHAEGWQWTLIKYLLLASFESMYHFSVRSIPHPIFFNSRHSFIFMVLFAVPPRSGIRKYVVWCLICGGLSCLLGLGFLGVYFLVRSYTSTIGYFETVPTFVPATLVSNSMFFTRFFLSFKWLALDLV